MISLCPGCHAKVGSTKVVLSQMQPLLLELWREQHPLGHEQTALDFKTNYPVAKSAPLFRTPQEATPTKPFSKVLENNLNRSPMIIGVWSGFMAQISLRYSSEVAAGAYGRIATMALVTMAHDGDNIGIYAPSFAIRSPP
jgi:hypothetical protein